ncbi:type VI immunity family protein [Salmonella enterica]
MNKIDVFDVQNIEALNNIKITDSNDIVVAHFALGIELFISSSEDVSKSQLYNNLLGCVEGYYNDFKDKLNYYALSNSDRYIKIRDNSVAKWRNIISKANNENGMDMTAFYDNTDEGDWVNACPWHIHFIGEGTRSEDLSSISGFIPVCDENNVSNFSKILDIAVQWCEKLKPAHGSAGFCFTYNDISQDTKHTWSILQRFPGIDQKDDMAFSLIAGERHDRIKGIDWITILGEPLVAALGGVDNIRAQLTSECQIINYNGGIIIVAGASPQLGDIWEGKIPERYREVSKLTKSIRLEDYEDEFLNVSDDEYIDNMEISSKWFHRFD